MTDTFNFLDRMDEYLASGPAVMTTARELCLTDRRVTKAADASRIPEADVRAHVVDVIFDVAKERIHEPLSQALFDHFAAVKAEFEIMEGELPEDVVSQRGWKKNLAWAITVSLKDSDVALALGAKYDGQDVKDEYDVVYHAMEGKECSADKLADAVLAVPVADPAAALSRMGATPVAIDALVAELRNPPITITRVLTGEAQIVPADWCLNVLARTVRPLLASGQEKLVREGVGYVLCESDPDLRRTGVDLLGLAGDASFETWLDERAAFSTPEQDRLDADEVMRLATQGENDDDVGADNGDSERVSGGVGGNSNARVLHGAELSGGARTSDGTERQNNGSLRPKVTTRAAPPVAAEESDLTRAVGAALAVLYDHGCETDKAMAEALGVQKAVVNHSRHGKAPWAPDVQQVLKLRDMVATHALALQQAHGTLFDVSTRIYS